MKTVAIAAIVLLIIIFFIIICGVAEKPPPPLFAEVVKALGFVGTIAAILSLHNKKV